ncbi:hypothetical protein BX616_006581, partial [Lobosporangium transversale]
MISSPRSGQSSAPAHPSKIPASSPSSSSSLSPSTLNTFEQLWSYIPFLSSLSYPSKSSSSPSSSSSPNSSAYSSRSTSPSPNSSRSSSSCSTRTCLSYCCSTSSDLQYKSLSAQPRIQPLATFNLRPKNYYSKRQRFMSSRSRIHSTSSVSHSDIGSDKDEYTGPHSYSHKRRSSPSPTDLRTPTTVETADVSTAMKLNTTTTITTTTTTTTHQTTSSRSDSVRNTVTKAQIAPEASTGPYLFVFDWAVSLYYPIRAMILFVLGFVFSLVIDHLQTQHQLVQYHPDTNNRFSNSGSSNNNVYFMSSTRMLFDTASWLPPTCGASAVLIGTIYPLGDYLWWGKRVQRNGRDWSGVM